MTNAAPYLIRNVILCDDIREELGNKKSLMGTISGDINVPSLPAFIQISLYFEFIPSSFDKSYEVETKLYIDDEAVAGGKVVLSLERGVATVIFPKGIVQIDKESTFRASVSVNGDDETEIMSKKIQVAPNAST